MNRIIVFLIFVFTVNCYNSTANNAKAINVPDSIAKILNKENKRPVDYLNISEYYFSRDSLLKASKYIDEAFSNYSFQVNDTTPGYYSRIKGYIYLYWGNYDKSIEQFKKVLKCGKDNNNEFLIISGHHGIGRVYSETGDYKSAINEIKKGVKFSIENKESEKLGVLYNAIGIAYQGIGKYDSSIYYLKKHSDFAYRVNDSINGLYSIVNIGSVYYQMDSFKMARKYMDSAATLNEYLGSSYAESAINGNLSRISYNNEKADSALYFLRKSHKIAQKNNYRIYMIENYKLFYEINKYLGNYDSSLFFLEKYNELSDSVYNKDKIKEIQGIKYEYQRQKELTEQILIEQKFKNQRIILFTSLLITLALVIISFLLISRMKLRKKIHKQEKQELELTIDEKNRKLVSKLMEESRKSESVEKLKETYEKLEKGSDKTDIKEEIKSTLIEFESETKKENQWQKIKLHFEEVHPDFFKRLLDNFPDLTSNDLKICAYTKMNLSTKEIASLLNITQRAVQTSRYRIKKKMNLDKSIDFKKYISEF